MDKKLEIGGKLKEFAENNFKSLSELSRKLGMKNPQQLYDYLNGRSYMGGEILIKLSDLGCDINWLLTGEKGDKHIIKEPEGNYNMSECTNLITEVARLKDEIKEYKVMIFDLQRTNERLIKENYSLSKSNLELRNEIIELQTKISEGK